MYADYAEGVPLSGIEAQPEKYSTRLRDAMFRNAARIYCQRTWSIQKCSTSLASGASWHEPSAEA